MKKIWTNFKGGLPAMLGAVAIVLVAEMDPTLWRGVLFGAIVAVVALYENLMGYREGINNTVEAAQELADEACTAMEKAMALHEEARRTLAATREYAK